MTVGKPPHFVVVIEFPASCRGRPAGKGSFASAPARAVERGRRPTDTRAEEKMTKSISLRGKKILKGDR